MAWTRRTVTSARRLPSLVHHAGRCVVLAGLLAVAAPGRAAALDQIRVGLMILEAPEGNRRALEVLAVRAAEILPRIESDLGARPVARFRMVLIPGGGVSDPELRRLDRAAPWWAAGFTIPALRLCVIRMSMAGRYPYGSIEAVLAHEATHMLLHDSGARIPLWFEEGVATGEGRRWEFRDMLTLSGSLLTADLPRLADLDSAFHASAAEARLAYAGSHAFVARTVRDHGPSIVRELVLASRDRSFESAWRQVTGTPLEVAESAWRRASLIRYRWIPLLTASSTLWIAITFLSLVVGARKRAAARRTRERWDREERELERLEAESTLEGRAPPWAQAETEAETETYPGESGSGAVDGDAAGRPSRERSPDAPESDTPR